MKSKDNQTKIKFSKNLRENSDSKTIKISKMIKISKKIDISDKKKIKKNKQPFSEKITIIIEINTKKKIMNRLQINSSNPWSENLVMIKKVSEKCLTKDCLKKSKKAQVFAQMIKDK